MADETYNCRVCRDGHFVHPSLADGKIDYSRVVPCICMRDKAERDRRQRLLAWCELPPASEHMTFENWTPVPRLKKAFDCARAVADGSIRWLTLQSEVNMGKTHLAVAICRQWLEQGSPARYAYVPLLMDELRRGYNDGEYDRRYEMFLNVSLLVLDDLGVENATAWVQEKLDTIVDFRLMHELAMVVTTNLSLEKLPVRIGSRLLRAGEVVEV